MIEPSKDLLIPHERPPVKVGRWHKSVGCLFAPFIRWQRARVRARIHRFTLPPLLRAMNQCEDRSELEKLLGKPKFKDMKGDDDLQQRSGVGDKMIRDVCEVYETKRCHIYLFFKNGHLYGISGCERVTPWDVVAGIPWEIEKEKQEKLLRKRLKSLSSTEEREILQKNIVIQTFKLFLQTYLPWDIKIHDDPNILKLYSFIEKTGAYGNLSDLKEVLRRSDKAYKAFSKEMRSYTTVAEFAVRYAFCHPEIREKLSAFFLHPDIIHLIKKYDDLVED
jgi:hypothetical protein